MTSPRFDFTSDNTSGACPEAMNALVAANAGLASAYGTDNVTREAANAVRALLDSDADVRFVASGTAANGIACATLVRPFETMLCHQEAHIRTDETGAPGFFGNGLGLSPLPGASGKIDADALGVALKRADVSYRQSAAALSITNSTEYGAVYTVEEVRLLTDHARQKGIAVHLDGARLANAVAAGFDVKALKDLNIDILVLGGTKAGAPLSEAVVIFNKTLSHRFDARLKQVGQLSSKGRFVSAPWIGLLEDGAWLRHATHANAMARKLASLMPYRVIHPVEANAVFVCMDDAALMRLYQAGWIVGRFTDESVRFMCSWATTEAAVEEVAAILAAN